MNNIIDLQRLKRLTKRLISDGHATNQRELASLLGYTESGLSQILTGKVAISKPFINKLYEIEPQINKDWLETGEGEMLTNQTIHATNSTVVGSNINGSGNKIMHNDLSEIKMLVNEMAEQRKANSAIMQKKDEQIDRLLSIVEKFQK